MPDTPSKEERFWSTAVRTLRDPGHERFCMAYLESTTPTEAYRTAYHKPSTYYPTTKVLSKVRDLPEVKKRIQFLQAMRAQQVINHASVNEAYVVDGIKEIFERSMQIVQVTDKHGNPVGEFKCDYSAAAKASKMLGDYLGIFRERRQPSDMESKSSDELEKRIAAILRSSDIAKLVGAAGDSEGAEQEEAGPLPPLQ